MTDPTQSLPIAGWYPDPENERGDRWWNGSMWSDHRRARDAAPVVAPVAPAAPASQVGFAAPGPAPVSPAAASAAAAAGIVAPGATPAASAEGGAVTAPTDGSDYARPNPYAGANPYAATAPAATPYAAPAAYPQAYPQAYPGYAAQPYAYAPAEPRNGLAIASLITSLSSVLFNLVLNPVAGIVLGFLALRKAREMESRGVVNSGRGMAVGGIITGFVFGIGGLLLYIIIFASIASQPTYY